MKGATYTPPDKPVEKPAEKPVRARRSAPKPQDKKE